MSHRDIHSAASGISATITENTKETGLASENPAIGLENASIYTVCRHGIYLRVNVRLVRK